MNTVTNNRSAATPLLLLFLLLLDRHCSASGASGLRFLLLLLLHFFQICSFWSTPLLSLELGFDSDVLYVERLVCNFWRLSKALERSLYAAKNLFWELYGLTCLWSITTPYVHEPKCVDTQADCVDTTGYYFRAGFWEGQWKRYGYKAHELADQAGLGTHTYLDTAVEQDRSVSTHKQTVSTPLATASKQASGRNSECRHTGRLCRHHWQTVSTHRQNVSTPLADCVDTKADYVDTTMTKLCETGVPVLEEDIVTSVSEREE
ncbi:hypothetical protein Taro_050133 [Colocasia esculenta]|uniref:Uncharacterized protein n=1 Tax=Colocasia esculenta TaxID=4460 RepID=A0A843XD14_COLES|nr:hypothetical protein [Colocasia esculenta]